jgi:hypothetical protein
MEITALQMRRNLFSWQENQAAIRATSSERIRNAVVIT